MQDQDRKTKSAEALEALEQAWAYYMPEPVEADAHEPELFEYANAA